jgi:hypothetical protein
MYLTDTQLIGIRMLRRLQNLGHNEGAECSGCIFHRLHLKPDIGRNGGDFREGFISDEKPREQG